MVFQIRNVRQIFVGFLLFAIVFFIYSDSIVKAITSLSPLLILLITPLLNPIYILLIWSLAEQYGIRGIIGGFLIMTSVNIISIPHALTLDGATSQEILKFIPDLIFWDFIPDFLKFSVNLPLIGNVNLGVFIVYIIVSTSLIIMSLMI